MDNTELYFKSILKEDYRNLLDLSDGILRTDDGFAFNIHRYALAMSSKYFYAVFCGLNPGKKDVLIPGVSGKIMDKILRYVYTGDIQFNKNDIADLLLAIDYFLLDDFLLKVKWLVKDNLSVSNCLPVFVVSMYIHQEEILRDTLRFIEIHFEDILNDENSEFEEMPFDALKLILQDSSLCIEDDNPIWETIVKWVASDMENRLINVPNLLTCLKMTNVDDCLVSKILAHEIVAKNPGCKDIIAIKTSGFCVGDLEVMYNFLQLQQDLRSEINNYRFPSRMYYIVENRRTSIFDPDDRDLIDIHITYNESIDIWRKIAEIIRPDFLAIVNQTVYTLSIDLDAEWSFKGYDFVEKYWTDLENPLQERDEYYFTVYDGMIYLIGGISYETYDYVFDVEVYNSTLNIWSPLREMFPMILIQAEPLKGKIFVVGYLTNHLLEDPELGFQVYDLQNNTWSMEASPATHSRHFSLIAYSEKLYLISGKGTDDVPDERTFIQVFDPEESSWSNLAHPPYIYVTPYAIILDDSLIIYEGFKILETCCTPSVRWNNELECWESLKSSSRLNKLGDFKFFSIEHTNTLRRIAEENREKIKYFEKSPFN